jgi:hypothetical protein
VSVGNDLAKKCGQEGVLSPPLNFIQTCDISSHVLGVPFIQSITTHIIVEILKKSSQNGPKASFMLSVSANLKQVTSKAEHN